MEDTFQYGRLFADFGLKMLLLGPDDMLCLDDSHALLPLLESTVSLVVDCLSATNNQIVASSLKLLNSLLSK